MEQLETLIGYDEEDNVVYLEISPAEAATLACLVAQYPSLSKWEKPLSDALRDYNDHKRQELRRVS